MIELILEESTRTVLAIARYPTYSIVERVPVPPELVGRILALPEPERAGPLLYWADQYTQVFCDV